MKIDRRLVLFAFLLTEALVVLFMYGDWRDKLAMHYERQGIALDTAYRAAVNSFGLASQAYFSEAVARPEILRLFRHGQQAEDERERALARGRLYRRLWPTYERLRDGGLRQLHFHSARGESYLRFFSPEYYGDDLLATQPLVRHVHATRKAASGFDTGRSLSGFRYLYPLVEGDEFLGSVEMSIPFRHIQKAMQRLDESQEYQLILRREAVENKVPPGFLALYESSCLHPDYLLEDTGLRLPDSPIPPSDQARTIGDQLANRPEVRAIMDRGERQVFSADLAGATWSVTLLPIADPAGEVAAYVLAYAPDPLAQVLQRDFVTATLAASLLLGAILVLLCRVLSSREALRAERAYQQAITDTMGEGLYAQDREGRLTFINPTGRQLLGYGPQEALGECAHALFHRHAANEYTPPSDCPIQHRVNAGQAYEGEEVFKRNDGHLIPVELASRPLYQEGLLVGSVTLFRDISERKRAEERLQLAASVFTSAHEGIMITDPEGHLLMVNEAFTRITGYSQDEVAGHNPNLLSSGRHDRAFYRLLWEQLRTEGYWRGELWNRRKNGELYLQLSTISAVRDEAGNLLHFVGLFADITEMKEHQEKLDFLAHYDALTELPNRVLLLDRLNQAMKLADREQRWVGVLYVDLDEFKGINETYGREVGDQMLLALAKRLAEIRRAGDTVSRLSGDEFAVVFVSLKTESECLQLAQRVLQALSRPVRIGNLLLETTASVGITYYPQGEEVDADQLLRQADQAMYQAKLVGKSRYHVFDAAGDRQLRDQHESLGRLERALARGEFVLYYQPKVNLRTGEVVGAEALLRWQHPERGVLAPGAFLDDLLGQPLEVELSRWVMSQALAQMETWRRKGVELAVSVNVPAQHLQQLDFIHQVQGLLQRYPELPRNSLELEILESSALDNLAHVTDVIKRCAALGVDFSLDDFGTGYSSLSYLKRIPVRILKIDRTFVRDMLEDPSDLALLEAIVQLAHVFQRQLIAEGMETPAQGERLLMLGCDVVQGYGIARPMPAEALPTWLEQWRERRVVNSG